MRMDMKTLGIGALAVALSFFGCSSSTPSGPTGGPVTGSPGHALRLTGRWHPKSGRQPCELSPKRGCRSSGLRAHQLQRRGQRRRLQVPRLVHRYSGHENLNATFTVTAATLADGQPATGANIIAEVYLNDVHPAPNSGQATTEEAGGVYNVGPILFDSAGTWTVRFHLHEDCQDATDDSPHGHAAFFIAVP